MVFLTRVGVHRFSSFFVPGQGLVTSVIFFCRTPPPSLLAYVPRSLAIFLVFCLPALFGCTSLVLSPPLPLALLFLDWVVFFFLFLIQRETAWGRGCGSKRKWMNGGGGRMHMKKVDCHSFKERRVPRLLPSPEHKSAPPPAPRGWLGCFPALSCRRGCCRRSLPPLRLPLPFVFVLSPAIVFMDRSRL